MRLLASCFGLGYDGLDRIVDVAVDNVALKWLGKPTISVR